MWFGITNYLMSIFYKSVSDRKIVIWNDEDGVKLINKMKKTIPYLIASLPLGTISLVIFLIV